VQSLPARVPTGVDMARMKIEMCRARKSPWAFRCMTGWSLSAALCADGREAALLMNRRNACAP